MKHTPGPWFAEWDEEDKDFAINYKDDSFGGCIGAIPNEANARLIAAAPALLDAAELAYGYLEAQLDAEGTDTGEGQQLKWLTETILAAIDSARGQADG